MSLLDQSELIIADALLQDVSSHDVLPSLASLRDLKKEIIAVKHKFSKVTIMEINAIVEAAEQYLSSSMSLVNDIKMKNEDWNAVEERKKLHADTEKIDPQLWKKFNSGVSNNASGDHLEAFVSDALDKIYQRGRQTAVVFRGIDLTKLETSQSNSASN